MDDSELKCTLSKLRVKVSQFSGTGRERRSGGGFLEVTRKPIFLYALIPLVATILLFIWKPGFITHEVTIDGELPERKVNPSRFLITVLIISIMLGLLLFTYQRKRKMDLTINET